MNQLAFNNVCALFNAVGIGFDLITHAPCRTSAESYETRLNAGFDAVGAKALVVKLTLDDRSEEFDVLVLPGHARLDSAKLKSAISSLKKFRFATPDELWELCGVKPGAMPPFSKSIFPMLSKLYIDESITRVGLVGFNAASLENSIVVSSDEYLKIAAYDAIIDFAEEP